MPRSDFFLDRKNILFLNEKRTGLRTLKKWIFLYLYCYTDWINAMKRKRRASCGLLLTAVLLLLFGVCGLFFCFGPLAEKLAKPQTALLPLPLPLYETAEGSGRNESLSIYSAYALLYDLDAEKELYSVEADTPCHPASLTKIMTIYAAMDALDSLDPEITVGYGDLAGLYEANASMAGLQEGDVLPVRDLLYATMLPSGADAANALARAACGGADTLVEKMNETAAALGMEQTHFKNVTGLSEEGHYTTARDMTVLLKAALQNENFRAVFCTDSYTTVPTSAYPQGIPLQSTLSQRLAMMQLDRGPILGGKTGYTEEAGLCLASLASVGGHEYILVTMGAEGDGHSVQTNLLDALKLYGRCK